MKRSIFLIAVLAMLAGVRAGAATDDWRLAIKGRSFMLVGMDFFQSLDKMAAAGVKYVDVTPSQKIGGGVDGTMDYKMDEATRLKVAAKLKETGVSMPIYYISKVANEADCRQLFEFCKKMNVEVIIMEPKGEVQDLDMLEKYCDQYHIYLAIHNHPQPSHYWNVDTVLETCKGRNKWIGGCADTGHWKRSGLDPLECLKKMNDRIVMLHFKDVALVPETAAPKAAAPKKAAQGKGKGKGKTAKNPAAKQYRDVEWGTGDCQAAAMLTELKRQGFKGYISMEYEDKDSFLENLPKNIAWFEKHRAQELGK